MDDNLNVEPQNFETSSNFEIKSLAEKHYITVCEKRQEVIDWALKNNLDPINYHILDNYDQMVDSARIERDKHGNIKLVHEVPYQCWVESKDSL